MKLVAASRFLGRRFALAHGGGTGTVEEVVIDAFWGNAAFAAVRIDGGRPHWSSLFQSKLLALPAFSREELHAHAADVDFLQRNARYARQYAVALGTRVA